MNWYLNTIKKPFSNLPRFPNQIVIIALWITLPLGVWVAEEFWLDKSLFSINISGLNINLARIYPFLMSVFVFLSWSGMRFVFFTPNNSSSRATPSDKILEKAYGFIGKMNITLSQREKSRLVQSMKIWPLGIAVNCLILGSFLFYFSTKAWVLYSTVYFYLLLVIGVAAQITYVHWPISMDRQSLLKRASVGLSLFRQVVCFSLFILSCCLYVPLIPVIFVLSFFNRNRFVRTNQFICGLEFKFLVTLGRITRFIRIRLHNPDSHKIGKIIVANHISMFDIISLIAFFPRYKTFINSKFLSFPFLAPIALSAGYIPVRGQDMLSRHQAYKRAHKVIKGGGRIIVFPEGSRSKDGSLQNFYKSIFQIAVAEKVDITPIFITSNRPIFNRSKLWQTELEEVSFDLHVLQKLSPNRQVGQSLVKAGNLLKEEAKEILLQAGRSGLAADWMNYGKSG